jgi:hypothetical protein
VCDARDDAIHAKAGTINPYQLSPAAIFISRNNAIKKKIPAHFIETGIFFYELLVTVF